MRHAMQKWSDPSHMTQEQAEAFSLVEETLSEYTYIYGETAYRPDYSDGMLVGMEQETDRRKAILSLKATVNDKINICQIHFHIVLL